jgi:hypothetical protein
MVVVITRRHSADSPRARVPYTSGRRRAYVGGREIRRRRPAAELSESKREFAASACVGGKEQDRSSDRRRCAVRSRAPASRVFTPSRVEDLWHVGRAATNFGREHVAAVQRLFRGFACQRASAAGLKAALGMRRLLRSMRRRPPSAAAAATSRRLESSRM